MAVSRRLLTVVAFSVLALVGCGSPASQATSSATASPSVAETPSPSATASQAAAPSAATVQAMNFAFNPKTMTIKAGTSVTFQNEDSATHTFTADQGAFDSGPVGVNQTFSFTFSSAGSFAFHCKIHPFMTGTIQVTP